MVTRDHVAELLVQLRQLADGGAKGRVARKRIAIAVLDSDLVKRGPALAFELLADELAPWVTELVAEVTRLEGDDPDASDEGMLWLDHVIVRMLAKVDTDRADAARRARRAKAADSRLRWELWTDAKAPVGVLKFARVLWSLRVFERWRQGVRRPAAMVRAVAEPLARLGLSGSLDEVSGEFKDARGERVARLNPEVATVDLEVMRRGLSWFRSTLAKRLVRFFAREAHRAEVRGDYRPELVLVDGGLVGLAERIGADPGKDAGKLSDLLRFGRAIDLSTPGLDVQGLWYANTLKRSAPGRRSALEVGLNRRVFLAGAAESMKATGANTRQARRSRLLVPLLQHDPPYRVPNHAERGRVWSVADAVLILLVDNASDLANENGARIDSKGWGRLVADAGLDERRMSTVRDRMLDGDGVSPRLLERTGPDRFTLASEHAAELEFIVSRVDSGRRNR